MSAAAADASAHTTSAARKDRCRPQRGNNNAYCQDNEISWFDWTLLERYADLHRFVRTLIRQRLMLGDMLGLAGLSLTEILHEAQIQPHGGQTRAEPPSRMSTGRHCQQRHLTAL